MSKELGSIPKESEFVDAVTLAFDMVIDMSGTEKRGGVFHVLNHTSGEMLISGFMIGLIEGSGNFEKYFGFAQEKANRHSIICDNTPVDVGFHLFNRKTATSWSSRNEEKKRYGGAILTTEAKPFPEGHLQQPEFIMSFSGLTEHEDEAIVTIAAFQLKLITEKQAKLIAEESGNKHILDYLGSLDQKL